MSSPGPREPASPHGSGDWFEQRDHRLRFGWGPNGLRRLAPGADLVVVVDVLSFSTSVDVALGRGSQVLPYRWHDGTEDEYARGRDAVVAVRGAEPGRWSLRPSSLIDIPAGTRLVLPSPNGSALTFGAEEAGARRVAVACLRNAAAVGRFAAGYNSVSVIAAGERWRGATGPLRPAVEDLLGAGAILAEVVDAAGAGERSASTDPMSPEARAAKAAFDEARPQLAERLRACGSGKQLIEAGHGLDVELAADLNTSSTVPVLDGEALIDAG